MEMSMESLTIHGIPRVAASGRLSARAVWFVLCLVFISCLALTLYNSYIKFQLSETTIKSTVEYYPYMEFPAITICNVRNFVSDHVKSAPDGPVCVNDSLPTKRGPVDNKMFCLLSRLPCGSDAVTPSSYSDKCFHVNLNGKLKQRFTSTHGGISLLVPVDHGSMDPVETGKGISVFIHSNRVSPFITDSHLLLSVGTLTVVTIKKFNMKRLESPYASNCTIDGSGHGYEFEGDYTMNGCRTSCVAEGMAKNCNNTISTILTNMMQDNATLKQFGTKDFRCNSSLFVKGMEHCHCQLRCFSDYYRKSSSFSQWPSSPEQIDRCRKYIEEDTGCSDVKHMSDAFIKDNFLKVIVSYYDFSNTSKEELPAYDVWAFVSDIGGLMGLFIGASLFSLIELLVVVMAKCFECICSRENKTDKQNEKVEATDLDDGL